MVSVLTQIPPARPVLLLKDGHASHTSIEVIELARANNVNILCFPPHTTHVLQPLDVGVFKSFKTYFSKACSKYMSKHPGRVVTVDKLAGLVAEAWPNSFTSVNIMSGFKKTGVHPLNPGEVSDRQLMPSKAVHPQPQSCSNATVSSDSPPGSPLFSTEQVALYEKRYEEKYNIFEDPSYVAWLRIYHPDQQISPSPTSSLSSGKKSQDTLSDILVLPEPKPLTSTRKSRRKTAACITDNDEFERRKSELEEKKQVLETKELRRAERQQRREEKQRVQAEKQQKKGKGTKGRGLADRVSAIDLSSEESDATCPKCGLVYSADDGMWIECDGCQSWFNLSCTNIRNPKNIPERFICENCVL